MEPEDEFEDDVAAAFEDEAPAPPKNKRPRGEVVSKQRMLRLLGIAQNTLDRAIAAGCPVVEKGTRTKPWMLNTADVVDWFRARDIENATKGQGESATTWDKAKLAEKNAATKLKEIKIAESQKRLLPAIEVKEWVQRAFASVRSRVLQVETQIVGLTPEQREDVKLALNDALSELSSQPLGMVDDDAAAAADDGANEFDSEGPDAQEFESD